jgi:4-hydroxybenzoate polyprenyltransferase
LDFEIQAQLKPLMTTHPTSEPTWLKVLRLLRWDKPEGRLILMIPALWAVFLSARGTPPWGLVGVIVLGTLATSAAGCVANDLWDRNIDPQVQRTRNRPLASRALSIKVGLVVMLVGLVCAYGLAAYLNRLTFWLCVVAVPVILLYPGAKRVFPVPQLVLSIAWGFAILISWSAVSCSAVPAATPCLGQETWLLWAATVLWTLAFDTVYALPDREDDRRIGVNSSALFFGKYAPQAIGAFYTGTIVLLAKLGLVMQLDWAFWLSLAMAAIGWAYQYYKLSQGKLPNTLYALRLDVLVGFVLLAGMIAGS